MRVGTTIPVTGTLPISPGLAALARAAESAGAASIWVDDHLVGVWDARSNYPYPEDDEVPWTPSEDRYESLTCCAWLAAATSRCRVGTAALVLPQRNALEVAKVAATVDRLSRGRLVLGVGIGWNRAEMEALGYPFETRGARADRMLGTMRDCWEGFAAAPSSEEGSGGVQSVFMQPTPLTRIPVLVGGMSDAALNRAADHGDGWLAVAQSTTIDLMALEAGVAHVKHRISHLPDNTSFEFVLKLHGGSGAPAALANTAADVARAGFTELIIEPDWRDTDKALALVGAVAQVVS